MHLWGGNKKRIPWENSESEKLKGHGRNCPLACDFTTCKVKHARNFVGDAVNTFYVWESTV